MSADNLSGSALKPRAPTMPETLPAQSPGALLQPGVSPAAVIHNTASASSANASSSMSGTTRSSEDAGRSSRAIRQTASTMPPLHVWLAAMLDELQNGRSLASLQMPAPSTSQGRQLHPTQSEWGRIDRTVKLRTDMDPAWASELQRLHQLMFVTSQFRSNISTGVDSEGFYAAQHLLNRLTRWGPEPKVSCDPVSKGTANLTGMAIQQTCASAILTT